MKPDQSKIDTYQSKDGKYTISKSTQHKEMFNVVENATLKAHLLHTSDEVILGMYPVDQPKNKKK